MKVFVTGAGALLGQGLIQSLKRSALKPTIVAVDPNPLSAGLYWADCAHLVPMAADPAYGETMRRLLGLERPDAVLVGTDVELAFFAQHRPIWEREFDTQIVVSSPEVVAIADDKWLTCEFLKRHGFDHPQSALPEDVDSLVARIGFPLIVKPRRGARSIGVSLVTNAAQLQEALAGGRDLIVQECVGRPEDEHTSGLICFEGKCLASITMRRDLRDGNTYRAFPLPEFPQDAELRRIAEALAPHGPVNFQFRLAGGRVKIFEINGRFSGTTPLRGLVNFPEVEMVLRHLLRGERIVQPKIGSSIILRHWSETIVDPVHLVRPTS
jgi:carbamoyl-phosphate synthase large subunit